MPAVLNDDYTAISKYDRRQKSLNTTVGRSGKPHLSSGPMLPLRRFPKLWQSQEISTVAIPNCFFFLAISRKNVCGDSMSRLPDDYPLR